MTLRNQKQIVVIDDNRMFDRAYVDLMKLPFERGWAQWGVVSKQGELLYRSSDYRDVSAFLKQ